MGKERITITIPSQMLEKIDSLVDGDKYRSRSHAMESFLAKGLGISATTAIILAGKKKMRLHPLQRRTPLVLVPVNKKPVAKYLLKWLKENGFTRVILSVDYKKDKIKKQLGEKSGGVSLEYVEGKENICDALLAAGEDLEDECFVLVDGSNLVQLKLDKIIQFHQKNNAEVTVALKNQSDLEDHRVVEMEGPRITRFVSKPGDNPPTNLVETGVYVMSSSVLEYAEPSSSFREDLLPLLAKEGLVYGYPFTGEWVKIKDGDSIKKAEKIWK